MIDSERVSSVQQFVKVVSSQSRAWQKNTWDERTESSWLPWFRGEEQATWPTALKPKLYRTKHKLKEVLRQEQDLRLGIQAPGIPIHRRQPADGSLGVVFSHAALWGSNAPARLV